MVGTAMMPRPGSEPLGDGGLLGLADQKACFEGEREDLAKRVDLLLNRPDMIRHVAEQRLHGWTHHRQIVMFEPAADLDQRPDRVSQAQDVAPQPIKPLDLRARHRSPAPAPHCFDLFLNGFGTGE
jgi:hypothetical protein